MKWFPPPSPPKKRESKRDKETQHLIWYMLNNTVNTLKILQLCGQGLCIWDIISSESSTV